MGLCDDRLTLEDLEALSVSVSLLLLPRESRRLRVLLGGCGSQGVLGRSGVPVVVLPRTRKVR